MERGDWLAIISMGVFLCSLIIYCQLVTAVWPQPKLTVNSPGSQLVVATDAAHDVTCYCIP